MCLSYHMCTLHTTRSTLVLVRVQCKNNLLHNKKCVLRSRKEDILNNVIIIIFYFYLCRPFHHCHCCNTSTLHRIIENKKSNLKNMSSETCAATEAGSIFVSTAAISVAYILAIPTFIWLICYLIPQIYMAIRPIPDLKKKYNATWALVTGAGSGIGKAIAFKLASQGLNVVVVSLDDDYLKQTMKELKEHYPELEFRSVGCTFSPGVPYLEKIKEATKDIDINIVFNNAG